jgi:hypothetical protein
MIYFPSTRVNISRELPVAVGSTIAAEGIALMADNTGGVFGAKATAGAGTDVFLGIAVSQQIALGNQVKVESFTVGASNTVVLARTPVASTLGMFNVTTGAVIPAGAGGWTLSAKTITLDAAHNGKEVIAYYKFTPTAAEVRFIQGDVWPGGPAGAALSQIGVAVNGIVYTDQFDTQVNWNAAAPAVKTAANGQFTIGGSGAALAGVQVIAPPTPGFGFLGLQIG